MALNEIFKTFIIYVTALKCSFELVGMIINLSQIAPITLLQQDQAYIKVWPKYVNYTDIFLFNLRMKLFQNIGINKHIIKLEKGKVPSYKPIYSLGPIELKTLKIYTKTYQMIKSI